MLDLQILRIRQILDLEILFYLPDTIRRQMNDLVLLVDNEIAGLLDLLAHDGIHLGKFLAGLSSFQRMRHIITKFIEFCGFPALAGDNQRRTGLIDQDRVNLIDDGIVQIPLYQLVLIDDHIVAQIIKSKLVIRNIRDITSICRAPLFLGGAVQHHAHRQSQEFMHLSHPLRITVRQIIVDCDHMDALALQCVQISRQRGYQRLSFTGTHLRNTSLMQNHAADQLHPVMLHPQHAPGGLPDRCKCLRKQIIQRCSF